MEQGVQEGAQTFDQVMFQFYQAGKISLEQALINADSANNLRLKIKLAGMKAEDDGSAPQQKEPAKASGFQIKGPPSGSR
jgi:twitching motility protein PilU